MFIYYTNDLITKNIQELEEEIENIDGKTEDDGFLLQDLYMAKNKLMKKKKSVRVTFGFCACLLVLVAILGIF